ncbi:DUF4373 domain-containing protein [uncultured Ruminococcus sp.]|uniref:DUF4373 domain-containing protein n=1 Tax=uncultured Ruminococcus sp. TaxID=165186 RepID=UPI0026183F0F|nr:DUF4373 domain-containing protein [uncultured Ruminococcus sp.]
MAGYNMPAILLPTVDWSKHYPDKVLECFEYIEASYGLKGYAILTKLWLKVCGSAEGYYCEWNDRVCTLFANKIHAGKGLVLEILNELFKEDFFNDDLYEKYGILTADWIQDSWLKYMSRRKNAKILNKYLLVKCVKNSESVSNLGKIASKKDKNANKNETTELYLTEHNLSILDGPEYKLSNFSKEQYDILVAMSDERSVDRYIGKVIEWQRNSHKTCREPFKTISKWISEDKKSGKQVRDTSYDLDDYEEFAMNYDLSEVLDKDDKL